MEHINAICITNNTSKQEYTETAHRVKKNRFEEVYLMKTHRYTQDLTAQREIKTHIPVIKEVC